MIISTISTRMSDRSRNERVYARRLCSMPSDASWPGNRYFRMVGA